MHHLKRIVIFTFTIIAVVVSVSVIQIKSLQATNSDVNANKEEATSSIYLPALFNKYDGSLTTPIFGVQMYGNTSDGNVYHSYLIGSGASWLRGNVSWSSIEPNNVSPASFNWGGADNNLSAARSDMGGLNMIVTIDGAPTWAADESDGPINSGNLVDYAEFISALIERYDGDGIDDAPGSPVVLFWEFYNEPDNNATQYPSRWGDNGAEYAQMLSVVYPVVKAANPEAQVVMGGLAYDWFEDQGGPFVREFLSDVLEAGGGQYFDYMNFHSYPPFAWNWTTTQGAGVSGKKASIQAILQSYGYDKPFVISEAGYHDNANPGLPSTSEEQARYVVALFTESIAADIEVMIWWMLHDPGGFYPYANGLVTNAAAPIQTKPSYAAYQNIVQELSTAHFVRAFSESETGDVDVVVYEFVDYVNNRTVYVVWRNPVDIEAFATVNLPASIATVRDSVTFAATIVQDGDDGIVDGRIAVQVNGRPQYVEVDR